jgi:hypothetical protein
LAIDHEQLPANKKRTNLLHGRFGGAAGCESRFTTLASPWITTSAAPELMVMGAETTLAKAVGSDERLGAV